MTLMITCLRVQLKDDNNDDDERNPDHLVLKTLK